MKKPDPARKKTRDLSFLLAPRAKSFFPRHPVILVFLIGVLATLIATAKIHEFETSKRQNEFDRLAKMAVSSLEGTLQNTLEVLHDVGSFYSASHTVERDEFKKFCDYLLIRHPSIHALEWIPRVFATEVSGYQEAARQDGIPRLALSEYNTDFQIIPAQKRREYYPVFFAEPYEANQEILGLDYASHPTKRAAMEKARDSGKPAATLILPMLRFPSLEPLEKNGLAIFIPIYRNNMPSETRLERLRNLHGYAAVVFSIKTLIENSFSGLSLPELELQIFAETTTSPNHFIGRYPQIQTDGGLPSGKWSYSSEIEVADKRWKVFCKSTDFFLKNNPRWESLATLLSGLLLSFLISLYVFSFEKRRVQEIMAALSLTDELTQIYNRRGFLLLAEEHVRLALRRRQGFWLFVMDLDGLKKINDALGHPEGDRAIMRAARLLEDSFRKSDILARIGGDEFAALAIESVPTSLPAILQHFQEQVDRQNLEKASDYKISMSIGATFFDPNEPCSVEDLIAKADKELYRQKRERHARDERSPDSPEDL